MMGVANANRKDYASTCCAARLRSCGEVEVLLRGGGAEYYRHTCSKCGELSRGKLVRLFDSNGVECRAGDLIECPNIQPSDHGAR